MEPVTTKASLEAENARHEAAFVALRNSLRRILAKLDELIAQGPVR